MRMTLVFIFLVDMAGLLSAPSVSAQASGIEWEILNTEFKELYRKGQYADALVVAKKALQVFHQ